MTTVEVNLIPHETPSITCHKENGSLISKMFIRYDKSAQCRTPVHGKPVCTDKRDSGPMLQQDQLSALVGCLKPPPTT